jgi:citryl-CoA lyase
LSSIDDVESFVEMALKEKIVIYGFGHKIYKEADPRVMQLRSICEKEKFTSMFIDEALKIEKLLEKKKGKKICLNVDGFMAAVLLEMGFSPESGRGVFIIARTPGLVAQAVEEKEQEKPVRRVDEEDIIYEGQK